MKFVNFFVDGTPHVGLVENDTVADLTAAALACDCPECKCLLKMEDLIAAGEEGKKKAADCAVDAPKIPLADITYAPVVTTPEKILCIGLNYVAHAMEGSGRLPVVPEVFSKFNTALAAHNEDVPLPAAGSRYDYEAEMVIVIGKEAKCVSKEDAMDYVYGYTIGNDVSAREQQGRVSQWLTGKSPDKFGPVGPFIVTKDAIDGGNMPIRLFCNGEKRQESNTNDLIFDIPTLVSYISDYITLKPADIIFTGTCAGVIAGMKVDEKPWLKAGDEVIVEIDGIGQLRNVMR